jgi:TetR/AcrR family transcriptional regulator
MAPRIPAKAAAAEPKTPKKRGAPPRRPGRPAGSAGSIDQRSRLLDIALTLFARQGIADTPLAAIAREAGVTPAMVHYYFKTRDQLLDLLIEERFLPVRSSVESVFKANADDPVSAFTQLAQRFMDIAAEHPWFAPLWMREVISENGLLKQHMRKRLGDTNQSSMLQSIARWQTEGRLNPDLEPSLLFLSVLGLTILPLTASKTWRDDPLRSRLGAKEITRHALALLGHGIGPHKPTSKKH